MEGIGGREGREGKEGEGGEGRDRCGVQKILKIDRGIMLLL